MLPYKLIFLSLVLFINYGSISAMEIVCSDCDYLDDPNSMVYKSIEQLKKIITEQTLPNMNTTQFSDLIFSDFCELECPHSFSKGLRVKRDRDITPFEFLNKNSKKKPRRFHKDKAPFMPCMKTLMKLAAAMG